VLQNLDIGKQAVLSKRSECPILVIGRNRPNHLANLLSSIPVESYKKLYIFLDGPIIRDKKASAEIVKLYETQEIANEFRLSHGVQLRIMDRQLGCQRGVQEALNWFFSREDYGLILEDDLIVHQDAITVASHYLSAMKNVKEVGSISLYRTIDSNSPLSPNLSNFPSSWGWATWKDRWDLYDSNSHIKILFRPKILFSHGGLKGFRRWGRTIFRLQHKKLDSWAYRWLFTFWLNGLKTLIVPVNMIENRGFDDLATHTKKGKSAQLYKGPLDWPRIFKKSGLFDESVDREILGRTYGIWREK
jgi:hypothetical protein